MRHSSVTSLIRRIFLVHGIRTDLPHYGCKDRKTVRHQFASADWSVARHK